MINDAFDRAHQSAAIGAWTAWTGTAFALGPLLGGPAVDLLSWRWFYAVSAVPVVIAGLIAVACQGLIVADTLTDASFLRLVQVSASVVHRGRDGVRGHDHQTRRPRSNRHPVKSGGVPRSRRCRLRSCHQ
jgi:MFS family permease